LLGGGPGGSPPPGGGQPAVGGGDEGGGEGGSGGGDEEGGGGPTGGRVVVDGPTEPPPAARVIGVARGVVAVALSPVDVVVGAPWLVEVVDGATVVVVVGSTRIVTPAIDTDGTAVVARWACLVTTVAQPLPKRTDAVGHAMVTTTSRRSLMDMGQP
jgi:hypothetical protein